MIGTWTRPTNNTDWAEKTDQLEQDIADALVKSNRTAAVEP